MNLSRGVRGLFAVAAVFTIACGSSDEGSANSDRDPASSTDVGSNGASSGDPGAKGTLGAPNTHAGPAPSGGAATDAGHGTTDASDGSVSVPPGSCGTSNPAKGFIASLSVKVGALTRTYALDVPAGYDGTQLYPLVIGYHGDGGTGAGYRSSFPIQAQGANAAIFAWPNGTNDNNGHSFDQNDDPPSNKDVAYFDALVAAVRATYCVNSARIYVHGMSGGAYFTNQLGRWRATVIRAIAPQSGGGPFGIQSSDYDPKTGAVTVNGTVATFIVHGEADTTVPITEGQKSLAYWRMADQSTSGQGATTPSPCQRQNGGSKAVVFCAIPGLSHAVWSGAPAAIWQFFAAN